MFPSLRIIGVASWQVVHALQVYEANYSSVITLCIFTSLNKRPFFELGLVFTVNSELASPYPTVWERATGDASLILWSMCFSLLSRLKCVSRSHHLPVRSIWAKHWLRLFRIPPLPLLSARFWLPYQMKAKCLAIGYQQLDTYHNRTNFARIHPTTSSIS